MTTTSLAPAPVLRVYDNAGNLAVSGSVYTYVAGTSTPIATYTDASGNTANTNPVILNSRGECDIWLSPNQAYKFVAYDVNNNLLWSTDNITTNTQLPLIKSITDYGAVGDGITDNAAAVLAAAAAAGQNGTILVPPGSFAIASTSMNYIISCGGIQFIQGGVLIPTPGSQWIIDAKIYAGDYQIFNSGKWCTACDCDSGSATLRSWNYMFESTDVGKPVCFLYGGAYTGSAPTGNYVQNRLSYNTTITGYSSDFSVTVAAGPTTPIRQDYVIQGSYANLNTGVVTVGNGTILFSAKVNIVNALWFGTDSTGHAINKAIFAMSRIYGGAQLWFPDSTAYTQNISLIVDTPNVTFKSNPRLATLFRANGTALQRMNSIQTVWRGRYGGGGPVVSLENWTFGNPSPKWVGDWQNMSGFVIDGLVVNGNEANQPSLTPGTGVDSWDSGLSTLLTSRVLIKSPCSFVNTLRWGAALSTGADDSCCEDGVYFSNCGEGGFYCETSARVTCGAISVINSPVSGWNMGAVTFTAITGGSIQSPMTNGCNNGIYIRNGSTGIDCSVGSQLYCLNNAVWVFDESAGSHLCSNISIKGGSVGGSANGVIAQYVNNLGIEGVKGAVTTDGIFVAHSTQFDIANCAVNGGNFDINLGGGTVSGQVHGNQANVEITSTSSTYLTIEMVQGYAFTNSGSGIGYLTLLSRTNDGAGHAFHNFGTAIAPAGDNLYSCGTSANRWSVVYAATGTINTSDQNEKEDIQSINPLVLKAWGKINYAQWLNKEAVQKKGSNARIHHGLIAQQIEDAFRSEGLDPFAYGLLCKDNLGIGVERYGVRYDEALALECAYLRSLIGRVA